MRHVITTSDFSYPSEDYTGQLNDIVARKTREMFQLHAEMVGREPLEIEEVKITEDLLQNGKKKRKKRNLEKYAPLIFEECYMKQRSTGQVQIANTFELTGEDKGLEEKVNPNRANQSYKGAHLFVMCHGF